MTTIACADCDTVLIEVPEGIDPDSIDLDKYTCKCCGVYDEVTREV